MNTNKTTTMLNMLLTIHIDRMEGYLKANKQVSEFDLNALFYHLISTSKKCKEELKAEILILGGLPNLTISKSGVFFRVWKYIGKSLAGKDRRSIILSCEFEESLIENYYQEVLENNSGYLNEKQIKMIETQKSMMQTDKNYLKSFSEAFMYSKLT